MGGGQAGGTAVIWSVAVSERLVSGRPAGLFPATSSAGVQASGGRRKKPTLLNMMVLPI